MKKVIFLLMALVTMGNISFAQAKKKASKETVAEKQVGKKSDNTPQRKMRKDGSPDMRYKANKEAAAAEAKPTGPLKKDGTPDKRYKANKGTNKK